MCLQSLFLQNVLSSQLLESTNYPTPNYRGLDDIRLLDNIFAILCSKCNEKIGDAIPMYICWHNEGLPQK